MTPGPTHQRMASDIWAVVDLLRGDYRRSEYGRVILPFTVLRRLDTAMAPALGSGRTTGAAPAASRGREHFPGADTALPFRNTSGQTFKTIAADPANAAARLRDYIGGFSGNVRAITERFEVDREITRLENAGLLHLVAGRFASMEGLDALSGHDMGYVFEHLIRKFHENAAAESGEHFTPREVIRLMVSLLTAPDEDRIRDPGATVSILDPACGTGGMLTVAEDMIRQASPGARIDLHGQELNAEAWATCESEMLLRGRSGAVRFGNSLSDDGYRGRTFDYMLANPPFGVDWKRVRKEIEAERDLGPAGRFGAGLPRVSDGSFLFLQHMLAKMNPVPGKGSRLAIVFSGSPLFAGAADSGESEIRRWVLENDWLEGIVALPDQLFYNTGIGTYIWILSNRKPEPLRGRVILLDARGQWEKMRRPLGSKRKQISEEQAARVTGLYTAAPAVAADDSHPDRGKVKILRTADFGYRRITVERPLRLRFEITGDALTAFASSRALSQWDGRGAFRAAARGLLGTVWRTRAEAAGAMTTAAAGAGVRWPPPGPVMKGIWSAISVPDPCGEIQRSKDGTPEPDPGLRDCENVPLDEDIHAYLTREVIPHVPDAWIDETKTKTGYEIPFTRYFYTYTPPRPLSQIDAELRDTERQIQKLLSEITGWPEQG